MEHDAFKPQVMGNGQRTTNTVMDDAKYHVSFERFNSYYGGRTTALVLANTVFLILSGDFREAFAAAKEREGLQACFDVYLDNLHKANHASDHHLILRGDNTFGSTRNATNILGGHNILRLHEAARKLAASQTDKKTTCLKPES